MLVSQSYQSTIICNEIWLKQKIPGVSENIYVVIISPAHHFTPIKPLSQGLGVPSPANRVLGRAW